MEVRVIGFIPPVVGVEGKFNTFRLGSFYTKNLEVGEEVYLINEREKLVFGAARVTRIETGPLGEMCLLHAATNHSEIGNDPVTAHERLFKLLQRFYGPHIAEPKKKTTVVFLERI